MESHSKYSKDKRNKPYKASGWKHEKQKIKEKMFTDPNKLDNFVDVNLPNKPRPYSVSIAVPASILEDTCLKEDIRTYLIGQLARSAVIYGVDEIVVFNDHCWKKCQTDSAQQKELMGMAYVSIFCKLIFLSYCKQNVLSDYA